MYKGKTRKEKLLAYAQYGKQTKPPPMVIEWKRSKLCLQPRKSKRLNLIYHLNNRTFFDIKQPVISFLPYFSNYSKPNDMKDRAAIL